MEINGLFIVTSSCYLMCLGVIMVYSSSSIVAISRFDKPKFLFKRQLITLVVGTIVLIIIATIPYKVWRKRIFVGELRC